MIVPSGKRREQVGQGPFKSDSIFDKLFEKIAIAAEGIPGPITQERPGSDELRQGLDRALGPGSNSPGISGNTPPQMGDLSPKDDVGLGREGVTPAGADPTGGNAPADQFLGPAPVENQDPVDGFAQERQKIRQFLGYKNFGVKMTPGTDGSMKVVVIPPQGQPVDVGGLLEGLQASCRWSMEG